MKTILTLLFCTNILLAQKTIDSIAFSVSLDENIVITGQYSPTDIQNSSLPIRVITKEMIERRAASNLTEIFQQEANIRVQQDAVLGTSMTMNGLEGKHIKILIDGVPMVGRNDGNLDLDRIQVQDIERIEIIENAMSVVYGTDALGGTINIITKKEKKENWNIRLMGQVQSNQLYTANFSAEGRFKGFFLNFSYNFNHFSGFSTDTLRSQTWNPKKQHAVNSRWGYQIPKTNFSLAYQFSYLNESIDDKGIVKLAAFPSLSYAKDYEFNTQTQEHILVGSGYLDNKKHYYIDILLAFNDYQRQKNAYFRALNENPASDTLDKLDSDTTAFQAWNLRAFLASQYRKKIDFQVGIDLRYDYTSGARILNNFAFLGDYAVFVNFKYKPIPSLTLDAGCRVSYNTLANIPMTYSAGLKWNIIDGMNFYTSYSRGIRTPSLKELYLDFVDVNHYIQGNSRLKPEYAHNIRVGWAYNYAYLEQHILNFNLNAFYNYIEQQITLYGYDIDSVGNYIVNNQSNKYAYFNLDKYQNWGINTSLKYQFKGLTLQTGLSLIGHYNNLSENYKEQIKPFQYTLEFSQEISYTFSKIDLSLSIFRRDYDKQISYTATTNPITQKTTITQNLLEGYGLMDFNISKSFLNKGIILTAGIKNLLDVGNINLSGTGGTAHGGTGSISVGMGRIFFVKLVIEPFKIRFSKQKMK